MNSQLTQCYFELNNLGVFPNLEPLIKFIWFNVILPRPIVDAQPPSMSEIGIDDALCTTMGQKGGIFKTVLETMTVSSGRAILKPFTA